MATQPAIRHNLPPQPTSFIGREAEIAAITALLNDPACRLLTLAGPGGIGKTRLAIEVAARLLSTYGDGVFFVPLQPLTSHENIVPTIATSIGYQFQPDNRDPRQQLLGYFQHKSLLLLMDNFEHLLDGVDFLTDLLAAAPDVKIATTSRIALNLRGEWLYDVRGLQVASDQAQHATGTGDAVRLFAERAKRVSHRFSLSEQQTGVVRICQIVNGMPLAIELASTWTRTLSCDEIADEIQRGLTLLHSPLRDAPEHHRSMQAVFDRSWELLTDEERTVFRRMSVFRGGCTREALQSVTGAQLPTLHALIDKSFIRHDRESGRYEVHELLRQYGEDQLEAAGEEDETRDAHLKFYSDYAKDRGIELQGHHQIAAVRAIEADFENLRISWQRAVFNRNADQLRSLLIALTLYCQMQSRFADAKNALSMAVQAFSHDQSEFLRDLLLMFAWFTRETSDPSEHRRLLAKGLGVSPSMTFSETLPVLFSSMSYYKEYGGFDQVEQMYRHNLAEFRERGDRWRMAWVLHGLGILYRNWGRYEESWQHQEESLSFFKVIGDRWGSVWALTSLGELAEQEGEHDKAVKYYKDSLAINQEIGDRAGIAFSTMKLTNLADSRGQYEAFNQTLIGTLKLRAEYASSAPLGPDTLYLLARWLGIQGQLEWAIEIFAFLSKRSRTPQLFKEKASYWLNQLETEVQPDAFASAVQRGESKTWQTIGEGLMEQIYAADKQDIRDTISEPPDHGLIDPLTAREAEVLQLIADGLTNREIADRLVVVVGTVKSHINAIYQKLHVRNRIEAVSRARELSLL